MLNLGKIVTALGTNTVFIHFMLRFTQAGKLVDKLAGKKRVYMDINFNFLTKFSQAITHLFTASSSRKTKSHDIEKGVISLNTIATQSPLMQSQRAMTGAVSCASLATGDDFIGREEQQQKIRHIISQWRQQQGELTAVVAPAGAGLSAFLAQIIPLLAIMHDDILPTAQDKQLATARINSSSPASALTIKPLPRQILYMSFYQAPLSTKEAIANICYCFGITPPDNITDTIRLINQHNPQLILIDDLHKLMLRMMGNSQALITFATIMMETRKQHCWLVGCEMYVWQRLSAQYQIGHLIHNQLQFGYFNAKELAQIQRRQLTDIGLIKTQVLASKSLEATTAIAADLTPAPTPSVSKKSPLDDLLKQLYAISQGHLKLASLLLQYSLEHQADINDNYNETNNQTDNDTAIEIYQINISSLRSCQDSDLFSLAEIYVHGGLRVYQHAHIFAITNEQSILQLEYLVRQGLLLPQYSKQDFAAHFYIITPPLTHIIANHLVNNNKLYH